MRVATNQVKYHPRNGEFFPHMEGNKWEEFKQDIVENGILNPLLLTEDYIAVAGNERLRAANETGIQEIECTIKDYHGDEDAILFDLLRDNLMRRGGNGCSPMQLANIASEWGRLRRQALDRGTSEVPPATEALKMGKGQLYAYRKLLNLTPDWQAMVENGFNYQFAARMIASMPPDEQDKLAEMLPNKARPTTTEVQKLLETIKQQEEQLADQEECIRKYEEDEDATSDMMEEMFVKLQDANEQLAAMRNGNAEQTAVLIEQAHKDRDAALKAARIAEESEHRIKRSTEWLEKTRNAAQEELARQKDVNAQVANLCNIMLGMVRDLQSVESVFSLLDTEQRKSTLTAVENAISALQSIRSTIHLEMDQRKVC